MGGLIIFAILTILSCITIVMYILLIKTILSYRRTAFKGSFWRLILSMGLANLIHLITNAILASQLIPISKVGEVAVEVIKMVLWLSDQAQSTGLVLVTVNRYQTILDDQVEWERNKLWIPLVSQWFLAGMISMPLLFLYFITDNNLSVIVYLLGVTKLFIEFAVHPILHYVMWRHMRNNRMVQTGPNVDPSHSLVEHSKNVKHERRILLLGIVISVVIMIKISWLLTHLILLRSHHEIDPQIQYILYHGTNLLMAASQPYILLVMCRELREHFVKNVKSTFCITSNETPTLHVALAELAKKQKSMQNIWYTPTPTPQRSNTSLQPENTHKILQAWRTPELNRK